MRRLGTLTLTHSSRRTNPARASVQFLTARFGDPRRLDDLPPLERLPPAKPLYSGAASLFAISSDSSGRHRCRRLGTFRRAEKLQQLALVSDRELLAGFELFVERWKLRRSIDDASAIGERDIVSVERFEHPHLVGLHTVEPLRRSGRALLSCSSPDAVLVWSLLGKGVERELRMPERIYGRGYEPGDDDDLRLHHIPDHLQTTHLNAASVDLDESRVVVSTLIQGAVGVFDLASGSYEEKTRGFVGCHGARFDDEGLVYFADSVAGTLVFLNDRGTVGRRFGVPSRWLHDVQQIEGSIYAFALSDSNELRIYDIDRDELLYRRRFFTWPLEGGFSLARRWPGWLGNSTQSLSYRAVGCD